MRDSRHHITPTGGPDAHRPVPGALRRRGPARLIAWASILALQLPAVVLAAQDGPVVEGAAVGMEYAAKTGERPMTLAEAIDNALRRNDDIVIVRESLTTAEAALRGAGGAYDPLLQVDGGWSRSQLPVNSPFSGAPPGQLSPTDKQLDAGVSLVQLLKTGGSVTLSTSAVRSTTNGEFTFLSPAWDTSVGVEFRQPLLRGLAVDRPRLILRAAVADRDQAEALLRRQVTETVAAVERAYWSLVSIREEVTVREEAVRLAEEQLEQTRIRIESGVSPETEIAQPTAEVERRRGELLAAREAVSRAENALKLLILGDADTGLWSAPIAPADSEDVSPADVDVDAAMEQALVSRPEIAATAAARERRELESRFARDEVKPSLDAVVSYDRYGLAGSLNPNGSSFTGQPVMVPSRLEGGLGRSYGVLQDGDFDDARIGLVFSIPIGNRSALAAVEVARSASRQAQAEESRVRKQVRAEVLDAAAAVRTAYQRYEAARAERSSAEVQLAAERDRYQVGLSTNFLVLTRQNDLSRARLGEISARTDYRIARMELARSTASLLEERGIEFERDAVEAPANG